MTKKQVIMIFLSVLWACPAKTWEYVYPVSAINSDQIFYIHQKSLAELELWQIDFKSGQFEPPTKLLYWRFMPISFSLLPNRQGFSFIDSGRVWIKQFAKRSPKAIDLGEPVFDLGIISWLDDQHFYFSGKQKDGMSIFFGNSKKSKVKKIYDQKDWSSFSPNIIGHELFFIQKRYLDRASGIFKIKLNDSFKPTGEQSQLVDCGFQQIVYLNMLAPDYGFYIEHMPYIHDQTKTVTLVCYKLELVQQKWQSTKLFNFEVPKLYLFGNNRATESLAPFLPRGKKPCLYFADIKQNESGECVSSIYSYNLLDGKIIEILKSPHGAVFFAPLQIEQKLFYGQILASDTNLDQSKILLGALNLKN